MGLLSFLGIGTKPKPTLQPADQVVDGVVYRTVVRELVREVPVEVVRPVYRGMEGASPLVQSAIAVIMEIDRYQQDNPGTPDLRKAADEVHKRLPADTKGTDSPVDMAEFASALEAAILFMHRHRIWMETP